MIALHIVWFAIRCGGEALHHRRVRRYMDGLFSQHMETIRTIRGMQ